jgi:hypothetical protein
MLGMSGSGGLSHSTSHSVRGIGRRRYVDDSGGECRREAGPDEEAEWSFTEFVVMSCALHNRRQ